jgi:hypothetical protein
MELKVHGMLKKIRRGLLSLPRAIAAAALVCWVSLMLSACGSTVEWKEDVRLLDGRIITVTQKKRCEGGDYRAKTDATCLAREAWVTINFPEFSEKDIVWHESLDPMIINVYQGKLYIVGTPPTTLEFRKYGALNPPYYGFIWDGNIWRRIPFSSIPKAIYDGNMLIESIPKTRTSHVGLYQKASENDCCYRQVERQIDPQHRTSAY